MWCDVENRSEGLETFSGCKAERGPVRCDAAEALIGPIPRLIQPSSFLFLVRPGAPSSVLAPGGPSDALCYFLFSCY